MRLTRLAGMGLVAAAIMLAGCKSTPPPTANHVSMLDYRFDPESLNVAVGTSVTWMNNGAVPHTSTSGVGGTPDGKWDSQTIAPGDSFSRSFDSTGAFHYYCQFHGSGGMTGVIVVHQ